MRCASLAALALCVLPTLAAAAEVSPSEVLRKADQSEGTRFVRFNDRKGSGVQGEDKTLSPYFYVAGGDPETERLPLKETSAQVQIAGVIVKVKVKQVFENDGTKPIEAIYVFPASTRAAVHGMRMKIGSRTVEAKIQKKAEARAQYEQAKAEGKRASLLEQERPNVFTMNVANVMPKDRIEVELDYSELLVPEDSVYEFVYPTVVGPRYGGGADPQKDKWVANPHLQEGQKEPYRFDINVHVETGIPLKELSSPSHKIVVNYLSKTSADVRLQESGGGTKDYVLRYRLAGDQIESGVLLWKGEQGENFFVVMLEPPQRPTLAQIPPREFIFLIDVSGSMNGFPLDTAKELARNLLSGLRRTDLFNVVLFSGAYQVLSAEGSLPATPANIATGTDFIHRQRGGGGTELAAGLRGAYAIPKKIPGLSRTVVAITDGFVGVESQTYKFVREHLNEANCFAFGIGRSVNRGLIEGLARAGQGVPFVVLGPDGAKAEAEKLRKYIESPVLTHLEVTFPGFEAREVAPMKVPDLLASRPVILFGKFKGEPQGKIHLSGFSGGGKYEQSIDVKPEAVKAENAPIRWLWARKWVAFLDDELHMTHAQEIEDAITDLGLSYTLLTTYTSFVAIDSEVVNKTGAVDSVKQPLPMPEGVSNLAIASPPQHASAASRSNEVQTERKSGGAASDLGSSPGSTMGMGRAMAGDSDGSVKRKVAPMPDPSPSSPAPVVAAAPPPAKPSAGREPMEPATQTGQDEARPRRDAKAGQQRIDFDDRRVAGPSASRFVASEPKAAGLNDPSALVAKIKEVLAVPGCIASAGVRLKLTVDQAGRVVKVEVLEGDRALGTCLEARLRAVVSATLASGATGTLELWIRPL